MLIVIIKEEASEAVDEEMEEVEVVKEEVDVLREAEVVVVETKEEVNIIKKIKLRKNTGSDSKV